LQPRGRCQPRQVRVVDERAAPPRQLRWRVHCAAAGAAGAAAAAATAASAVGRPERCCQALEQPAGDSQVQGSIPQVLQLLVVAAVKA
jgi:hypothetical protein